MDRNLEHKANLQIIYFVFIIIYFNLSMEKINKSGDNNTKPLI